MYVIKTSQLDNVPSEARISAWLDVLSHGALEIIRRCGNLRKDVALLHVVCSQSVRFESMLAFYLSNVVEWRGVHDESYDGWIN